MAANLQAIQCMHKTRMNRRNGFSLIELVIVVAIILVIAAIAIPNLLRARIAADESSAAGSVRQIATAEVGYHVTYSQIGYAPNLASLGGAVPCAPSAATACILDDKLSAGFKSGYQFFAAGFATGGSPTNTEYVGSAAPNTFNQSGMRDFCIIADGVLRMNPGASAAPPVGTVATCLAYAPAP
jgi:prepilin-type N-terminal cleavage/methylation domain-containing protein